MTDVSTEVVEPAATMERHGGAPLITFNRPRALHAVAPKPRNSPNRRMPGLA
ncbi:hypothetical protein [Streptomyces sp. AS58]|uniref:hypothetical protein n=1 Tax=Streptomyces sp. AS58 TaxID=1519489 RepID=UPI00131E8C6C|nr:hypothetical protein [Streptomyces sp. AS58]